MPLRGASSRTSLFLRAQSRALAVGVWPYERHSGYSKSQGGDDQHNEPRDPSKAADIRAILHAAECPADGSQPDCCQSGKNKRGPFAPSPHIELPEPREQSRQNSCHDRGIRRRFHRASLQKFTRRLIPLAAVSFPLISSGVPAGGNPGPPEERNLVSACPMPHRLEKV
jgi:hypothetical protein